MVGLFTHQMAVAGCSFVIVAGRAHRFAPPLFFFPWSPARFWDQCTVGSNPVDSRGSRSSPPPFFFFTPPDAWAKRAHSGYAKFPIFLQRGGPGPLTLGLFVRLIRLEKSGWVFLQRIFPPHSGGVVWGVNNRFFLWRTWLFFSIGPFKDSLFPCVPPPCLLFALNFGRE